MIMLYEEGSPMSPVSEPVGLPASREAEPFPIAEQLVSLVAPGSFAADQYRALRHIVERMHNESGLQVLAVTSPTPGDGKTITTLNLAGALAQGSSAKVLLIDADLRRPTVSEYLPLGARARGLVDVIMNPAVTLAAVVQRFDALNLSVLPAGSAETGTYELLTSSRFEALLTEARAQYDYVLVDTPPLVPVPDSRLIGRWVDGFLVIVAAHKTPRRLLAEALNLLDPDKAVGLVFNFDNRPLSGYHGYYGYGGYTQTVDARGGWLRRLVSRGY